MGDGKQVEMLRQYIENEALGSSLTTDSLAYLIEIIEEHIHVESKVYPTLAAGVTIGSGPGAWALGNITEVVPVNTITEKFDIHWISIEAVPGANIYELAIYKGLALSEIEVGRIRFAKVGVFESTLNFPIITPVIAANERISAALADAGGGGTADISISYHEYV